MLTLRVGIDDESVDAALEQATRTARNRLSQAREAFANRVFSGDVVFVRKAFITREAGREYVWLRVEEWSRAKLAATVSSATQAIANVALGDRVTLEDDEILDWRIERSGGPMLGNFGEEALRRMVGG
ncbi:MAG: DUF2314 domain-containing protein [Vulcanimicrobiaceae bacterium]